MIRFDGFLTQYESIRDKVDGAIQRVLKRGWFILGEEVERFEREFADYIGTKYAVGVASGTEAIALSLMALGIGKGHEVITTSMTAFPTITGIMQAGAKAVLVDILPDTGLIDPARIEERITEKTRALLPVHLYGQSCQMDDILALAERRGLKVVEDCAQSCGSTYGKKRTGSLGHCNAFSFYPTKNLGAYGDGGAVTTDDAAIYQRLLRLRNYGKSSRYHHDEFGLNSRLDEIQAAVLRVKLARVNEWNRRRREIAGHYRGELSGVTCLDEKAYGVPNYHLFVIKSTHRDRLLKHLQDSGVESHIHYPLPVSRQRAFPFQKSERFPACEAFADSILSIPLYPELEPEEQEQVIRVINGFKA
jgi:dTDP-4-amino-4,6-dideoxygalactose transaminase